MRKEPGGQVRPVRPLPGLPGVSGVLLHHAPGGGDAGPLPQVRRPADEAHRQEQKDRQAVQPTYCCEHVNARDEADKSDFMTWDVPVKDDCPRLRPHHVQEAGRGFKRPFCINPDCANFLPEEKRGYPRRKTEDGAQTEAASQTEEGAPAEAAGTAKKPAKKAASKAPAAKKTAASKTAAAKKTAASRTAAKKTTAKTAAARTTAGKATGKKTAAKKVTASKAKKAKGGRAERRPWGETRTSGRESSRVGGLPQCACPIGRRIYRGTVMPSAPHFLFETSKRKCVAAGGKEKMFGGSVRTCAGPPAAGGGRLALPHGNQGRKRAALGVIQARGSRGYSPLLFYPQGVRRISPQGGRDIRSAAKPRTAVQRKAAEPQTAAQSLPLTFPRGTRADTQAGPYKTMAVSCSPVGADLRVARWKGPSRGHRAAAGSGAGPCVDHPRFSSAPDTRRRGGLNE